MERKDLQAVRAAMEPPWDDLREQRVLRGAFDSRKRTDRRRRMTAIGAVACTVMVSIALVVGIALRGSHEPTAIASAPSTAPSASVLSLSDGSRVSAQPDAQVLLEVDQPSEVRFAQNSGQVLYEVAPNPQRQFVVRVSNVQVRVKGTAFSVKVDPDSVLVHVDRGLVAVDDGSAVAELGAGEELRRVLRMESPAPVQSSSEADAGEPVRGTPVVSIEAMLDRADRARAAGRLDEAAAALEGIIAKYPKDKRIGTVMFTLGRVERQRGNHAKAAAAFRACSHGGLAEDALAEEASSWLAAGQTGNARDAASRYLQRFPNGPHAARMRKIVQ